MKAVKWISAAASVSLLVTSTAYANNRAQSKVTLTFWEALEQPTTGSGAKKADWWLTKAINMYEQENPNTNIKLVQLQTGEAYDAQIKAAGVAQNGPDVATMFAGGQTLSNSKFLEPLDSYLSTSFVKSLTGWDTVRANFTSNGQIYGVPYGTGYYYYVYYNKKLLKKAGINPNGAMPKTWNDLLSMSAKLKAKGITPFSVGEKDGWNGAWVIDAWLSAQLGTQGIFDMYHQKIPQSDPAMVKSYQAWQNLFAKGYTNPDAPSIDSNKSEQEFLQGKQAMIMQGTWLNSDLYNGMKNNVGVFPVPPLNGSKYMNSLSGGPNNAYVVFKSAKHKQEAVKFIEFLTSAKIQDMRVAQDQSESSNNAASNLGVIKNPLLRQEAHDIAHGHVLGYPWDNVMAQQMCDYWYRTNAQVFAGKMDPKSAANSLEQEFQQENP